MKKLYLIGGTMGVGKSAVCRELNRMLPDSVFLDGDWCWYADPFRVTEETKAMVLDNICHLLNNFLSCSAYQNVVFCWVMHEQSIIDAILGELNTDHCRVEVISLMADEDTLLDRLTADVEAGLRSADVIGRSMERLPLYQNLNTRKIDTCGKPLRAVAEEIIEGDQSC